MFKSKSDITDYDAILLMSRYGKNEGGLISFQEVMYN